MRDEYGIPEELETTASVERELAEKRVTTADADAVRTSAIVGLLEAAFDGVRSLHVENGYAPKIRAIFRS